MSTGSLSTKAAENTYYYSVYGITLQTNKALPFSGLSQCSEGNNKVINVQFVDDWDWDHPSDQSLNFITTASAQEPITCYFSIEKHQSTRGDYFHLWYRAGPQIDFEIDAKGNSIIASGNSELLSDVTSTMLGSVLSCTMRLRGELCLHASVMKVGEQAIAIIGHKSAGKSTTATALALRGHAIVADDIAVLTESSFHNTVMVQPGYPALRLWPQSVNALLGEDSELPRVFELSEKRYFHANESNGFKPEFHNKPLPLAAIYVLGERSSEQIEPEILAIDPKKAVMLLMAHRSANFLEIDKDHHCRELNKLTQVAANIPLRQVIRSNNLDAIKTLCACIEDDVALLNG